MNSQSHPRSQVGWLRSNRDSLFVTPEPRAGRRPSSQEREVDIQQILGLGEQLEQSLQNSERAKKDLEESHEHAAAVLGERDDLRKLNDDLHKLNNDLRKENDDLMHRNHDLTRDERSVVKQEPNASVIDQDRRRIDDGALPSGSSSSSMDVDDYMLPPSGFADDYPTPTTTSADSRSRLDEIPDSQPGSPELPSADRHRPHRHRHSNTSIQLQHISPEQVAYLVAEDARRKHDSQISQEITQRLDRLELSRDTPQQVDTTSRHENRIATLEEEVRTARSQIDHLLSCDMVKSGDIAELVGKVTGGSAALGELKAEMREQGEKLGMVEALASRVVTAWNSMFTTVQTL